MIKYLVTITENNGDIQHHTFESFDQAVRMVRDWHDDADPFLMASITTLPVQAKTELRRVVQDLRVK